MSISYFRFLKFKTPLIFFIILTGCDLSNDDSVVPYHAVDQALVDRALFIRSEYGRLNINDIKKEVYPVVVHLPNSICVGLNLKRGFTGGDETLCFKKKTNIVNIHYINGQ